MMGSMSLLKAFYEARLESVQEKVVWWKREGETDRSELGWR